MGVPVVTFTKERRATLDIIPINTDTLNIVKKGNCFFPIDINTIVKVKINALIKKIGMLF